MSGLARCRLIRLAGIEVSLVAQSHLTHRTGPFHDFAGVIQDRDRARECPADATISLSDAVLEVDRRFRSDCFIDAAVTIP